MILQRTESENQKAPWYTFHSIPWTHRSWTMFLKFGGIQTWSHTRPSSSELSPLRQAPPHASSPWGQPRPWEGAPGAARSYTLVPPWGCCLPNGTLSKADQQASCVLLQIIKENGQLDKAEEASGTHLIPECLSSMNQHSEGQFTNTLPWKAEWKVCIVLCTEY